MRVPAPSSSNVTVVVDGETFNDTGRVRRPATAVVETSRSGGGDFGVDGPLTDGPGRWARRCRCKLARPVESRALPRATDQPSGLNRV